MSEYELADLAASNVANMYLDVAAFFTLFSAYIVMSYVTGDKLTRFQVWFINITFLGLATINFFSMVSLLNRQMQLKELLRSANFALDQLSQLSQATVYAYILFRVLLVIGCLVFMWQIRRGHATKSNT